jgi:transcriptional regulator with XRE-family HTH domain
VTAPRDLPRDIGGFIRDLRRNAQISLRQLAEQAGVSNPYLSQIERGLRKPSAEVLAQLAHALRVSTPAMYLRAGLLDSRDGPGVLAAIAADPDLNIAQKQSLTQIYETFRRENARGADDAADDSPAGETTEARETAEASASDTTEARETAEASAGDTTEAREASETPAAATGTARPVRKPRKAANRPARTTSPEPSAGAASAEAPGAKETIKETT